MTLRPPGLINTRTGDNTQQVTSATVESTSDFFKSIESVAEFTTPAPQTGWVSSGTVEIQVVGGGGTTPNEFKDAFMVGFDDGTLWTLTKDSEDDPEWQLTGRAVLEASDDTQDPTVLATNQYPDSEYAVATADNGNLYEWYSTGTDEGDPSDFGFSENSQVLFTVGGVPRAQIGRIDGTRDVFVAQPLGQAGEIYRYDAANQTTVWTSSIGGGFRGPMAYTSTGTGVITSYRDGSDNGFIALFAESDGTETWSLDIGDDIRGSVAVDDDAGKVYYAVVTDNASLREYVGRIDIAAGTKDWEYERSLGSEPADPLDTGVALGTDNVFAYPLSQSNHLAAFNKGDGAKQWETDVANVADASTLGYYPDERTTIEVLGRAVYVSISNDENGDSRIKSYDTASGDVITDQQLPSNPGLGIADDFARFGADLLAAGTDSGIDIYDTATRGIIGPIQIDSRPFVAIGSDSVGPYTVQVFGGENPDDYSFTDDTLPRPYLQEQLTFDGTEPTSEQVPWWPWKYLWVRIDDPDAEAGDVDLTVTTAR